MTDQAALPDPVPDDSAARRPLRYELPSVVAEQERRSRRLLLLVARSIFIVLLVTITVLTIASEQETAADFGWSTVFGLVLAATAVGVIVLVVDAMTPNKRLSTVVGVYIGICFGLIGAVAIGTLIDVIADAWEIRPAPVEQRTDAMLFEAMLARLDRVEQMQRQGPVERTTQPFRIPPAQNSPGDAAQGEDDGTGLGIGAADGAGDGEIDGSGENSGGEAGGIGDELRDSTRDRQFETFVPTTFGPTTSPIEAARASLYIGLLKVVIGIVLCYLSVSVVLTTKDDFRLVIPYVEFAKQVRGVRPLLVDTSALIDGRINDLGHTGFFDAPIIVPQFVIDELQTLADSGDRLKRSRGRRGLDMISRLQANPYLDVTIDDPIVEGLSVDRMLIELAAQQKLRILTTDFNLKKVAQIRDVAVLNINDLASTLKAAVVPGETLEVQVVRAGEGAGQGVGFLPDGTMVVVEEGADAIGSTIGVVVTNSLQTSAGRMIFGKPEPPEPGTAANMARNATGQPRAVGRPAEGEGTTPDDPNGRGNADPPRGGRRDGHGRSPRR